MNSIYPLSYNIEDPKSSQAYHKTTTHEPSEHLRTSPNSTPTPISNPSWDLSLQARGRTIHQQVRQPCLQSKSNGSFTEAIHNLGSSRNHVELASLLKVGVPGIHRFLCLRMDLVSFLNNAGVLEVRSFLFLYINLASIFNVVVLGVRGFPCRRTGLVRLRLGLEIAPSRGAYGLFFLSKSARFRSRH